MRFHNWLDRRDRGVTLVEVMVVVAILTLLAGLMFGVIGPARRKASQMQCLSNIRQVGQAFLMYMDDHSGRSPIGSAKSSTVNWLREIVSYGANYDLACPTFTPASGRRTKALGYAPNACVRQLSSVSDPGRTVLMTDVADFMGQTETSVLSVYPELSGLGLPDIYQYSPEMLQGHFPGYSVSPVGQYGAVRHGGGALYFFVDGHARWHRPGEVVRWESWVSCLPPSDAGRVLGARGGPQFADVGEPSK